MRKVPSLYYESELKALVKRADKYIRERKIIIDIGGTKESDMHSYFSLGVKEKIRNVNIVRTSETDLVMDAMDLKIKSNSVDAILSFNTLEHIKDDDRAIAEMKRVLKHGGFLLITMPFIEAFHSYGGDYRRYTPMEMRRKFSWLDVRECGGCAFFGTVLSININHAIKNFFTNEGARYISGAIGAWMFFWIKYIDLAFRHHPNNWATAATVYLYGFKK
jgi:SAM-dependent methyltransferase